MRKAKCKERAKPPEKGCQGRQGRLTKAEVQVLWDHLMRVVAITTKEKS